MYDPELATMFAEQRVLMAEIRAEFAAMRSDLSKLQSGLGKLRSDIGEIKVLCVDAEEFVDDSADPAVSLMDQSPSSISKVSAGMNGGHLRMKSLGKVTPKFHCSLDVGFTGTGDHLQLDSQNSVPSGNQFDFIQSGIISTFPLFLNVLYDPKLAVRDRRSLGVIVIFVGYVCFDPGIGYFQKICLLAMPYIQFSSGSWMFGLNTLSLEKFLWEGMSFSTIPSCQAHPLQKITHKRSNACRHILMGGCLYHYEDSYVSLNRQTDFWLAFLVTLCGSHTINHHSFNGESVFFRVVILESANACLDIGETEDCIGIIDLNSTCVEYLLSRGPYTRPFERQFKFAWHSNFLTEQNSEVGAHKLFDELLKREASYFSQCFCVGLSNSSRVSSWKIACCGAKASLHSRILPVYSKQPLIYNNPWLHREVTRVISVWPVSVKVSVDHTISYKSLFSHVWCANEMSAMGEILVLWSVGTSIRMGYIFTIQVIDLREFWVQLFSERDILSTEFRSRGILLSAIGFLEVTEVLSKAVDSLYGFFSQFSSGRKFTVITRVELVLTYSMFKETRNLYNVGELVSTDERIILRIMGYLKVVSSQVLSKGRLQLMHLYSDSDTLGLDFWSTVCLQSDIGFSEAKERVNKALAFFLGFLAQSLSGRNLPFRVDPSPTRAMEPQGDCFYAYNILNVMVNDRSRGLSERGRYRNRVRGINDKDFNFCALNLDGWCSTSQKINKTGTCSVRVSNGYRVIIVMKLKCCCFGYFWSSNTDNMGACMTVCVPHDFVLIKSVARWVAARFNTVKLRISVLSHVIQNLNCFHWLWRTGLRWFIAWPRKYFPPKEIHEITTLGVHSLLRRCKSSANFIIFLLCFLSRVLGFNFSAASINCLVVIYCWGKYKASCVKFGTNHWRMIKFCVVTKYTSAPMISSRSLIQVHEESCLGITPIDDLSVSEKQRNANCGISLVQQCWHILVLPRGYAHYYIVELYYLYQLGGALFCWFHGSALSADTFMDVGATTSSYFCDSQRVNISPTLSRTSWRARILAGHVQAVQQAVHRPYWRSLNGFTSRVALSISVTISGESFPLLAYDCSLSDTHSLSSEYKITLLRRYNDLQLLALLVSFKNCAGFRTFITELHCIHGNLIVNGDQLTPNRIVVDGITSDLKHSYQSVKFMMSTVKLVGVTEMLFQIQSHILRYTSTKYILRLLQYDKGYKVTVSIARAEAQVSTMVVQSCPMLLSTRDYFRGWYWAVLQKGFVVLVTRCVCTNSGEASPTYWLLYGRDIYVCSMLDHCSCLAEESLCNLGNSMGIQWPRQSGLYHVQTEILPRHIHMELIKEFFQATQPPLPGETPTKPVLGAVVLNHLWFCSGIYLASPSSVVANFSPYATVQKFSSVGCCTVLFSVAGGTLLTFIGRIAWRCFIHMWVGQSSFLSLIPSI